jgi:hypothetical protein
VLPILPYELANIVSTMQSAARNGRISEDAFMTVDVITIQHATLCIINSLPYDIIGIRCTWFKRSTRSYCVLPSITCKPFLLCRHCSITNIVSNAENSLMNMVMLISLKYVVHL